MKQILLLVAALVLTNCTAHSVKLGKKCTVADSSGSYEKSYVWIVDKATNGSFDQKINKENCKKNS